MWILSALFVIGVWVLGVTKPGNGQKLDDVIGSRDDVACSASSMPRILTDYNGWFVSPNYPNNYPSSSHCRWLIKSQNNTVSLKFTDFNLEQTYDSVAVYNGETTSDLVATFSGNIDPPVVHTGGPLMLVVLYTDNVVNFPGFNATYTSSDYVHPPDPCHILSRPMIVTDYSGTFQSGGFPDAYINNANCSWLFVSQEPDGIVEITFDVFATESGWDLVRIYDGNSTFAPLISVRSGNLTNIPPVQSSQRFLFMQFTSDTFYYSKGFNGTYTSLAAQTPGPTVTPPTTPRPLGPCGRFLHQSPDDAVIPSPYDLMCHLNTSDVDNLNTQCYDLIQDLPNIGNAQMLLDMGGNFGCYLTNDDSSIDAEKACHDNFQWRSVLGNCAACKKMFVCIRYK